MKELESSGRDHHALVVSAARGPETPVREERSYPFPAGANYSLDLIKEDPRLFELRSPCAQEPNEHAIDLLSEFLELGSEGSHAATLRAGGGHYHRDPVRAFKPLAVAATIATFILISIGGLVRATKSGLGCGDDWPHCSGEVLPPLQDPNQIIEFSHRAAAGIVGVMTAALAVLAYRHFRDNPRVLRTSFAALGLVIFQALLGMVVVKLHLAAFSVVLHLGTALSFLAVLIYLTASLPDTAAGVGDERLSRRARFAAGSVFLLLLVGSYVSGADAGYAFPDWPLMDGQVIPNLAVDQKAIHFFHRALAAIVGLVVFVIGFDIVTNGDAVARRFAHAGVGLFAVEIVIGALNVWTKLNAAAVTAHLAIGAAIWASFIAATFASSPAVARSERPPLRSRTPAVEAPGS